MIREKTSFQREELSAFVRDFVTEDLLFFDIETTGLSAEREMIYCIGCGYAAEDDIAVDLYFAEYPEDEENVLRAFWALLAERPRLVTFNGATFDLPFLRKRAERYALEDVLNHIKTVSADALCRRDTLSSDPGVLYHLDLYRDALRMKELLELPNYRQKSIEQFLGCDREDRMSGGELIAVYRDYVRHPDPENLRLLLLHNRDDVRGMFELPNILAYRQFAAGRFVVTEIFEEDDDTAVDRLKKTQTDKKESSDLGSRYLNIRLTPNYPLPRSIHRISSVPDPEPYGISFLLDQEAALIRIPIRHGELKHFFEDYQNYYYLPEEDIAIHRSVGSFVGAAHRVRATKKTCYSKKECDYVVFPHLGLPKELKRTWDDRDTCLALPMEDALLKTTVTAYFSLLL